MEEPKDPLGPAEELMSRGSRGEVTLRSYLGQPVAVKAIEVDEDTWDDDCSLCHPHLVRVIERRRSAEGRSLEIRELCEGGELFDVVAEQCGLLEKPAMALQWIRQICSAVAYCHSCGAVNGQLRPEHVLLDRHDCVRLLGFRKLLSDEVVLLRPPILIDAPELHARKQAAVQEHMQADLWAMGVMLASMLTAMPPLGIREAEVSQALARMTATGQVGDMPGLSAVELPPALLPFIEASLQPAPERRPAATLLLALLPDERDPLKIRTQTDLLAGFSTMCSPPAPAAQPLSPSMDRTVGKRPNSQSEASSRRELASTGSSDPTRGSSAKLPRSSPECSSRLWMSEKRMPPPPLCTSGAPIRPASLLPPSATIATASPQVSPQERPPSHVRCLGWDNLKQGFETLSRALVAALDALGVEYTVSERVPTSGLGWAFFARPPHVNSPLLANGSPEILGEVEGTNGEPGLPLRVSMWIFSSGASGESHHVNLRRTQA